MIKPLAYEPRLPEVPYVSMANVLAAANVIEHPTERSAAYHPVLKHSRRIGKADAPAKLRAGRYAAALEGQSDVS